MRETESVLIIDDESLWAEDLKSFLPAKYSLEQADDASFFSTISKKSFDVIVLDILMPEKNGLEVLNEIRKIDRRSVVLFWTALPPSDELVRNLNNQGLPVFYKGAPGQNIPEIIASIGKCQFKEPQDMSALVVDDEEENRRDYSDCLEHCGLHDVLSVNSVDTAEKILQQRSFDIILVDMMFRNDDGLAPLGRDLVEKLCNSRTTECSAVLMVTAREDGIDYLRQARKHPGICTIHIKELSTLKKETENAITRGPYHANTK